MIEVRRTNSTLNSAWPLALKVTEKDVRIEHDAQRDRDCVSLSREEWAWVVATVSTLFEAIDKATEVLGEVPS